MVINSIGVVVQARNNSKRLQNKVTLPFYKNKSILDLILDQLSSRLGNIPLVVATSTSPFDDIIEKKILNNDNCKVFRGSENNVITRFIDASDYYKFNYVIRICADNPFLQCNFINTLLETDYTQFDYSSFVLEGNLPVILSHQGFWSEIVSVNALKKVKNNYPSENCSEHVTNCIYNNNSDFKVNLIPAPDYLFSRNDLRFTVDTENDFKLMQSIYKYWIEASEKTIENLIEIVDNSEEIKSVMQQNILLNSKK